MHCIHVARWRWGKGRGCRSNLKGETRDCPTLHRASFRTGLLPASAEPTGNTGGTSEKTWMIKHCTATAGEKSWINFTISTADTKASKDEGAGDALSTRAEIPLQPTKTTAGKQAVLLLLTEYIRADNHAATCREPTLQQAGTVVSKQGSFLPVAVHSEHPATSFSLLN